MSPIRLIRPIFFWRGISRRNKAATAVFIILMGGFAFLYIHNALNPQGSEAAWFNDNWGYRQTVAITNSGSAQTDYQVSITLDTATLITAGKMRSDCNDLRITDTNGRLLPHWIETGGANACNQTTTKIWTNAPSIPTSGITLYLYYGNPQATNVQNGAKVFSVFFDDFSNTALDNTKWQGNTSVATFGGGVMKLIKGSQGASYGQNPIYTQALSLGSSYVAEAVTYEAEDNILGDFHVLMGSTTSYYAMQHETRTGGSDGDLAYFNGSGSVVADGRYEWNVNEKVRHRASINGTSITVYSEAIDNTSRNRTITYTDPNSVAKNYIGFRDESSTGFYVDWVFIRKFASTEPSVGSPASEEKAPGPVAYWKFDDGTGTIASDATSQRNNGTLSGATLPTWTMEDQCIAGKCIKFPGGTSGSVTVANSVSGVQSVSFWIKPASSSASMINLNASDVSITASSGTISAPNFTSPTIYVNGVQSTTLTANRWQFVTVTTGTGVTASAIKIGNVKGDYLKGFFDDVKLYNYARSAAQVKLDYASRGSVKGTSATFGSSDLLSKSLSDGLVGYWKMDESSWTQDCTTTSVADSSGNGNSGKSCPSTTGPTTGAGKFGNAGSFDGSNDYVSIAASTSLSSYQTTGRLTLSAWVNPTSITNDNEIIGGVNNMFDLRVDTTTIWIYINTDFWGQYYGGINYSISQNTNTWTLITATFDGSHFHIYVNGVEQTLASENAPSLPLGVNSTAIAIGNAAQMNGKIDEARVYNRALSSAEISALYNWAPGPIGYWKMDEKTGTTTNDSSGNGNTSSAFTGNVSWTQGKYGSGLSFDGTDDVVRFVETTSTDVGATTSSYAVSAWMKTTANYSGNATVLAKDDGSGAYPFELYLNSSEYACFQISDGTNAPSTCGSTALNDGKWHYLTGARDVAADKIYIYVDGILINSATDSTTATAANNDDVSLGNGGTSYTANDFNGQIDEVRIYNYARTQKQIVQDMNVGHPAVGSPVGSSLLHLKFDDGFGNVASNSGNQGTALNAGLYNFASPATANSGWTNSGKFGKALNFDGTNDFAAINHTGTLEPAAITISAWAYPTVLPGAGIQEIVNKNGTNCGYEIFFGESNYLKFVIYNGGWRYLTYGPLVNGDLNKWYHLVGTLDSTGRKFYVNGNQVASDSYTSYTACGANQLRVGDSQAYTPRFFNGIIDDVKVYNFALTADEVKLDMNRGSAQALGSLSDTSGLTGGSVASNSASAEYCIPGDTTSCATPVGRWDFEEGSGNANDTSGNGYTGTPTGTTIVSGKIGKARNFNGTSDYITASAPGITGDSALTIEAWVYRTSSDVSAYPNIVGFGAAATDQAAVLYFRNTGAFAIGTKGGTYAGGTTTSTQNQWFHVAGTYSGSSGTWRIYVNGIQEGNQAESAPLPNIGTTRTSIGVDLGLASQYFAGKIDQVRIFNYARSAAQVAWDYNRGGPVGYWKFDECQGGTANDSSGNGNNGTITIAALGTQTSAGTCTTTGTAWKNGVTGKRNYSLNLDGTDDYVQITTFNSLPTGSAERSVSAWIKVTNYSNYNSILRYGNESTTDQMFALAIDQTTGKLGLYLYSDDTLSDSAVGTGTWKFVTATLSGTTVKLYIDGVLVKTRTTAGTPNTQSSAVRLGSSVGGAANAFFNGQIDDVRIYNYALTPSQVKMLYNGGAVNFAPVSGAP